MARRRRRLLARVALRRARPAHAAAPHERWRDPRADARPVPRREPRPRVRRRLVHRRPRPRGGVVHRGRSPVAARPGRCRRSRRPDAARRRPIRRHALRSRARPPLRRARDARRGRARPPRPRGQRAGRDRARRVGRRRPRAGRRTGLRRGAAAVAGRVPPGLAGVGPAGHALGLDPPARRRRPAPTGRSVRRGPSPAGPGSRSSSPPGAPTASCTTSRTSRHGGTCTRSTARAASTGRRGTWRRWRSSSATPPGSSLGPRTRSPTTAGSSPWAAPTVATRSCGSRERARSRRSRTRPRRSPRSRASWWVPGRRC